MIVAIIITMLTQFVGLLMWLFGESDVALIGKITLLSGSGLLVILGFIFFFIQKNKREENKDE